MQFEDLAKTLEDAAYVTIGFGVLAFQKTQVRRRELTKQLLDAAKDFEARIEPVVEEFEGRLPEPAKQAVQRARQAGVELARKTGMPAADQVLRRNGTATKATAA